MIVLLFDFGGREWKNIGALSDKTEIIGIFEWRSSSYSHSFGEGGAVYIAGLPIQ